MTDARGSDGIPVASVPALLTDDTRDVKAFLTDVLGFEDVESWGEPDPETPRGLLRHGATSVALQTPDWFPDRPADGDASAALVLFVADLEAARARIAARAPERVGAVVPQPWGALFDVRGPDGVALRFARVDI